jgi:hypothetical protein
MGKVPLSIIRIQLKQLDIPFKGDANKFLNELITGVGNKEAPREAEGGNKREDDYHHRKRKRDDERKEIIPLHLRPRKLNFWDQRPEGYANMSADQVKATGMFLLPSHLLKGNDFYIFIRFFLKENILMECI